MKKATGRNKHTCIHQLFDFSAKYNKTNRLCFYAKHLSNDICNAIGNLIVLQVEAGQMYIFHYLKGDTDNDLSVSGLMLFILLVIWLIWKRRAVKSAQM